MRKTIKTSILRSKLKQTQKIPLTNPTSWFRPRASKKMTVELVQNGPGQGPFIWPDAPSDLTPYVSLPYLPLPNQNSNPSTKQLGQHRLQSPKSRTRRSPRRPWPGRRLTSEKRRQGAEGAGQGLVGGEVALETRVG